MLLEEKFIKGDPKVTVLIPCLNEEKNISDLLQVLNQMGYDTLVVDGHSLDKTVETAKDLGADVFVQNGNGKGAALREAFSHDLNGGAVVIMDADGSMNPKEIPQLIEALDSGFDVAKGSRFLHYGRTHDMTLFRRIGNEVFLLLVNRFWSANYTDLCYGFGAFTKDAIKKLGPHLKSTSFEIETEVFIKAKKLGLKVVEVPSIESRRRNGKSNLNGFRDGFRILRTIFEEFVDSLKNHTS